MAGTAGQVRNGCRSVLGEAVRHPVRSHRAEALAVDRVTSYRWSAPHRLVRLFQHRIEHRREVAGRAN